MKKVVLVDGTVIEALLVDRAKIRPGDKYGLRFKVVISTDPGCVVMVGEEVKLNFTTELTNLPADIVIE
jgi:hypothetical protein